MSAYALPGLFPPINYSSECSSPDECNETSFNTPLHHRNETSPFTGLLKASVDLLSVPSFTSSGVAKVNPKGSSVTRTSSSCESFSEEPEIEVKEAKIDPVRLIQSVTGNASSRNPTLTRKSLRRKGSRERLSGDTTSPQNSPVNKRQTMTFGEDDNNKGNDGMHGNPHDDAIEFELAISFNGRKYTATRTLQCIMQLRDDLIREMNARRQWLQIHQKASEAFSSSDPKACEQNSYTSSDDPIHVEIPEIPSMSGSATNGSSGFVGRGFTMLHAMATSYVPVMERWLRSVMAIVPKDSECLTNFLWEPLSNESFPLEIPSKSCTSLATLGSIKELDYHTDDDDDDDSDEDDTW
mmetsp:Transcript_37901/g.75541  ORF Transcript_37901/g.75541 Transcript_37901/m.75541 type:complete len:353 (+) Transcript_37901:50-1108(+)